MTNTAMTMSCELGPDDYFTITEGGPQHAEWVLVTPDLARAWLEKRNQINRPLRDGHVEKFIWILKDKRWFSSNFGPCFNCQGFMLDGQHRLTAVVRSGITARMWITFNVVGTYFDPIDTDIIVRRPYDVLPISPRDVAICNALLELERGSTSRGSVDKVAASHAQHRTGIEWATRAFPFQRGITASLIAAHAYAYPVAQRDVAAFAKQFLSYTATSDDAPSVLLHRYLDRSSRARLRGRDVAFAALRCLEAHCKGKPLPRLSVTDAGFAYFADKRAARGL